MKRSILILPLALALTLLCGCGAASGDGGISSIFYTRAATDEEAFSQVLEQQSAEEIDLEDEAVPMSGQPAAAEDPEEGWLLVRYAKNADGAAEPQWYRVWTEEGEWGESLPYEGGVWHPVLSASKEP